jgi:uncharacterized protein YggE
MIRHALILAAAVSAMLAARPALAEETNTAFAATTLRLSATGEAHVTPDIAVINLGVQTEAPTAAGALRQNRAQMNATLEALKARGVEGRDVQTSGLDLNAQYVFHQNEPRTLSGYQASNVVTIRVRDLAKLGATVDAVVAAGANQINGISFSLADPAEAQTAARRAAVKALEQKASLYAEATGYRIARLVSLSDSAAAPIIRPLNNTRVFAAAAPLAPTPAEPGELDVTATVSAVYELKKP